MSTIYISQTCDVPITGFSILSLVRDDNGQTPSGVSLPLALAIGSPTNGIYPATGSFTDTNPASTYTAIAQLTFTAGGVSPPFALEPIKSGALVSWYYSNQQSLQSKYGASAVAIWFNPNNNAAGADTGMILSAGLLADDQINRIFDGSRYIIPLTPIIPVIENWSNALVGYQGYLNRGIFDESTETKLTRERNDCIRQMYAHRGNTGGMPLPCQSRWPAPTAPIAIR